MKKLDHCCLSWKKITGDIEIVPTQRDVVDETLKAKCLEKLMRHFMGQYCPCCGTKLA